MAASSTSDDSSNSRYLIVRPENGGIKDLFRYWVWADCDSGRRFLESSEEGFVGSMASDCRWLIVVSIVIRKILGIFGKPLVWTGDAVEFILNLLSLNGNLFGLLCNILCGKVVVPRKGTEAFISTIGHFDGRLDLYIEEGLRKGIGDSVSEERGGFRVEMRSRALMDLCVMASKLAYENEKVIQNVVIHHWKMHFVGFYNCWNGFQKESSTQVFILCDKPEDANLILISFRGTEPFDADDWSTDFDYSWYEIPEVGKIHMGFLEALGLGDRTDADTFRNHLLAEVDINSAASSGTVDSTTPNEQNKSTFSNLKQNTEQSDAMIPGMGKLTAYYAVRSKLRSLLMEHERAKFVVTGHSLGGALAVLFPTVLVLHKEMALMDRLLSVYTFGQPRVGNMQLGQFMEAHLSHPVPKYFRVVYSNDLVPRLPYDNTTFLFKHFGTCLYYNSLYTQHRTEEEPNKNYFGIRYLIPTHLNASWELMRSMLMGYVYGRDYKEGWFSILLRVTGLAFPGVSAHCPINYVNCVRLGREQMRRM